MTEILIIGVISLYFIAGFVLGLIHMIKSKNTYLGIGYVSGYILCMLDVLSYTMLWPARLLLGI
jgi:hypothetical protein